MGKTFEAESNDPCLTERPSGQGRHTDYCLGDHAKLDSRLCLLSAALDQAAEGIAITDLDGFIQCVNEAFATMHGHMPKELSEDQIATLFRVEGQDPPTSVPTLLKAQGVFTGTTIHKNPRCSEFRSLTHAERILDPEGLAIGAVYTVRPIARNERMDKAVGDEASWCNRMLEAAPDPIVLADLNGEIVLCNAKSAEMLGFDSLAELRASYNHPYDMIAQHDRERALREFAKCLAMDAQRNVEFECVGKGGKLIPIEVSARTVRNDLAEPMGIVAIGRDVSERRQARQALEARARVETLVTSIATRFVGMSARGLDSAIREALSELGTQFSADYCYLTLLDKDAKTVIGRHIWCRDGMNPSYGISMGSSLDNFKWFKRQLAGKKCIHVVSPEDLPSDAWAEREHMSANSIRSLLVVPVTQSGRLGGYVGFNSVSKEIAWPDGLVSMLTIVGEIFAGVLERRASEEALRASEERFRHLTDNIQEMFWITSADFRRLVYLSPAFERVWGMPLERMYADPMLLLDRVHPDDRTRLQTELENARKRGSWEAEYRIIRPDGSIRWLRSRGTGVIDDDGEVFRNVGTIEDITERIRLEKEILDISSREQRKIGGALHDDLGQHLTGILCLSRGLARKMSAKGLPETDEAADIADLIRQAIAQTRGLARGLCPVDLEATGLTYALRSLASNTEKLARIRCVFRSDESVLVSDPILAEHLYRMAQEALTNAVRHSGATVIEMTLSGAGGENLLEVSDNGRGMPDNLEHCHGMGLKLMKYRARMSDARLEIGCHPQGGTIVSCLFRTPWKKAGQRSRAASKPGAQPDNG